jgi:SAM-dependent methyltransferase
MLNVVLKNLALFFGEHDERAAEYPWVLRQLSSLRKGSLVLDVGCSDSMLSHVLLMRGFRVVGLDIRDHPFKSKHTVFLRRNVLDSGLPDCTFDGILVVSTIEHIGLDVYEQTVIARDADATAIRELFRILKPGGLVMITAPFIGNEQERVTPEEKQYGIEGVGKLTKGMEVLVEDYFYLHRCGCVLRWLRLSKSGAARVKFKDAGIVCLVLRKSYS